MDELAKSGLDAAGGGGETLLAGRYRVVRRLEREGVGEVSLAVDTVCDNRQVVVKMLPPALSGGAKSFPQLGREVLASLKLTHPNIANLRGFEENGGCPFLVADYIEGRTLGDILVERGRLSEAETLKLLRPVAAAIDYAHREGVVHRGIKPANVMVRGDGTPFVLDFSLAREVRETVSRVTGKTADGTLVYMSPEQLRGTAPGPSQDVYSFAAMAYECLSGHPPFHRGQIEWQILNEPPPPLESDSPLARAVMAGLAKNPADRPGTCLKVLAVAGAPTLESMLAALSEQGATAPRNPSEVFERLLALRRAGGEEHAAALGVLCVEGLGGNLLPKERLEYLRAAAEAGDARAAFMVGVELNLPGTPAAEDEALAWYRRAVSLETRTGETGAAGRVAAIEARREVELKLAEERRRTEEAGRRAEAEENARDAKRRRRGRRRMMFLLLVVLGAGGYEGWRRFQVRESEDVRLAKVEEIAETQRKTEEVRAEEEKRRVAEENKRAEEEKRRAAEEKKRVEEEKRRVAEEKKRAEEEAARKAKEAFMAKAQPLLDAVAALDSPLKKNQVREFQGKLFQEGMAIREKAELAVKEDRFDEAISQLTAATNVLGRALARTVANPQLAVVVKFGGQAAEDAKIAIGDQVFTSPHYFSDLEADAEHGPYVVSIEREGKRYSRSFEQIGVDWKGPKTLELELEKWHRVLPAGGNAGDTATIVLPGGAELELVWCPAGTFKMGSDSGNDDERPVHEVALSSGFWIGKYEVTQAQWKSVMGGNPSYFKGGSQPVETVSWFDCQDFCEKAGMDLGLPTEAEWEYACRAGTSGDYAGKLDEMACYGTASWGKGSTRPVGMRKPNPWGIHDMHGNVREWCRDWYDGSYYGSSRREDPAGLVSGVARVSRGGSWVDDASLCRSANRFRLPPDHRNFHVGFRVVLRRSSP